MTNLNESLIKALQSIDANKEISDKFKSCSKENVYEMLRENGYNGSTQEFENLLSNIEKEIGDLLMQKKSDKDLSNVSGGKGANYFKKGLVLSLTALSVGNNTMQPGALATEVKQNANTKSFGEKAKEFFSKAKGKVSNFVDAHPGAALLLVAGAFSAVTGGLVWSGTKRYYNKTQTEIKQAISGARAQLLATCKDVIGVESTAYEGKLKAFETAVDKKVDGFEFDGELKIGDIAVDAVNEFKALFGDVSDGSNVFGTLSSVDGADLGAYINGIRTEIAKRLQNDSGSKFAGLKTKQLNFLSTVIGYAENVVMLKQAEHIEKVTSEVTDAKQTITNNLNSIQDIINEQNEKAFEDTSSDWRTSGDQNKAEAYKAVVTKVREGFEKVLESIFGDLGKACEVEDIKKVVVSLKFFEENIIDTDSGHKLKDLTGELPSVEKGKSGKTVSDSEADQATVNALTAQAADLKGFVNAILGAIKGADVASGANGLVAKFEVVKKQKNFLSYEEATKNKLIEEITKLMTIDGLEAYDNETTEFDSLAAAKEAFLGSKFVKTVDEWVEKLKGNQGNGKIFGNDKLKGIKNLTERVKAIDSETTLEKLAGEIDKVFAALIGEVKNLFDRNENFNTDYQSVIGDIKSDKKPGALADDYVANFKLADRNLFNEKKVEKAFKVNAELKKLRKDENSLVDKLEGVEIGGRKSKLKKDGDNSNSLDGKIGGNVDNLKVLLCAMVGDALYAKLENAFDGFEDLNGVEISKDELEKKGEDGFSYKFFAHLNEFDDNGEEDIKAFKTWIKDATGVELKDGIGVSKSIWDLITDAAAEEK